MSRQDKPNVLAGQRIVLAKTVAEARPNLLILSEVNPTPIRWLWPGRVPLGKLTLIPGDPGLGKSLITIDMAARVSRGMPWPDCRDARAECGGVVLVSAEDDVADTIRPRLDAAGADVGRIVALQGVAFQDLHTGEQRSRSFNLERDLPALEDAIQRVDDCRLVVIDPVSAYMGRTDSHRNTDVRGVLAPLAELAARYSVAIVCVTHLTKTYGGKALYRATGSLAFTAAARSAWLVMADKDDPDRRLVLCVKSNLSRMPDGLAYRVGCASIDGVADVPYLLWAADPVTMTANEALAAEAREGRDRKAGRVEASAEWLRSQLANGPVPSLELENRARDAGFSWASVRRAKQRLGAISRKVGFDGEWAWELPSKDAQDAEDAQHNELSTFAENEHVGDETGLFSEAQAEGAQDAQVGVAGAFEDTADWGAI